MSDMTVANTILDQLGGRRFALMTGAHSFSGDADRLTFKLPRGARRCINAVMIRLDPTDTYTVTFYNSARALRGGNIVVETVSDVYCDNLASVVSTVTGLAVTLITACA